jgi:hypothetical protein
MATRAKLSGELLVFKGQLPPREPPQDGEPIPEPATEPERHADIQVDKAVEEELPLELSSVVMDEAAPSRWRLAGPLAIGLLVVAVAMVSGSRFLPPSQGKISAEAALPAVPVIREIASGGATEAAPAVTPPATVAALAPAEATMTDARPHELPRDDTPAVADGVASPILDTAIETTPGPATANSPAEAEVTILASLTAPTTSAAEAMTLPAAMPLPGRALAAPVPQPANDGTALSAAERQGLIVRGDAMFGAGDVASARLFYDRAATAGDATAALRLGETFDPGFLRRARLRMPGDLGQARYWYRRARELGHGDAEMLLKSLEAKGD